MIRLKMKNCTMILTEKQQKYKHSCLEEILPSNQRQITEQASFAYFPWGKAFEKQTETIEDQGEKQKKAIKNHKIQLGNNELLLTKEREIFKNIYNERLNKIDHLSKIIDYGDLKFIVNNSRLKTNFSEKRSCGFSLYSIKNIKY